MNTNKTILNSFMLFLIIITIVQMSYGAVITSCEFGIDYDDSSSVWEITTDTKCSDMEINVSSNITISLGRLTLNNVTLNFNVSPESGGNGSLGIDVKTSSSGLFIDNSRISNIDPNYRYFWIVNNSFEINNVNISYCGYDGGLGKYGLTTYSKNSIIKNIHITNSFFGMNILNDDFIIINSTLENISIHAIQIGYGNYIAKNSIFENIKINNIEQDGFTINEYNDNITIKNL